MELVRSECSSILGGSLTNALIHNLKPFSKKKMSTLTTLS